MAPRSRGPVPEIRCGEGRQDDRAGEADRRTGRLAARISSPKRRGHRRVVLRWVIPTTCARPAPCRAGLRPPMGRRACGAHDAAASLSVRATAPSQLLSANIPASGARYPGRAPSGVSLCAIGWKRAASFAACPTRLKRPRRACRDDQASTIIAGPHIRVPRHFTDAVVRQPPV